MTTLDCFFVLHTVIRGGHGTKVNQNLVMKAPGGQTMTIVYNFYGMPALDI